MHEGRDVPVKGGGGVRVIRLFGCASYLLFPSKMAEIKSSCSESVDMAIAGKRAI